MRLARLVTMALAIVLGVPPGTAISQQKPATPAARAETRDIAEQLVPQMQSWFNELGKSARVPIVFTGITKEPRQLIVELDGLNLEPEERRRFLV